MSSDTDEAARAVWRLMFDLLIETNPPRQAVLARHGLTPNDSRALFTLDRTDGQQVGTLAKLWQCDPSTATWVIDRLERAGLAERRLSPTDRRVRLVVRTELGESVMRDLLAAFHEPPAMMATLDADELAQMRALLEKLARTRDAHQPAD